jgi:hypothetical protein
MHVKTFLQIQPNAEKNKIFKIENNKTIYLLKQEEFMNQTRKTNMKEAKEGNQETKMDLSESENKGDEDLTFDETNSYAFNFKQIFNGSQGTKDIFNYYEKTGGKKRMNSKFKIKNFFLLGDKNIKKNGFLFGKQFNSIKIKGMVEEYIQYYKNEEGLNSNLNLSSNRTIRQAKNSTDSLQMMNSNQRSLSKYKLFGGSESLKTNSFKEKKSILKMKNTLTLNNLNSSESCDSLSHESSSSDLHRYMDLFEVKCIKYVKESRFIMNKKFKFVPFGKFMNKKYPSENYEGKSEKQKLIVRSFTKKTF